MLPKFPPLAVPGSTSSVGSRPSLKVELADVFLCDNDLYTVTYSDLQ